MTYYRRLTAAQGKSIRSLINLLDALGVNHGVQRITMNKLAGPTRLYQLELHT